MKDGTWPEKMGDVLLGRTTPEAALSAIDPKLPARVQGSDVCDIWFFASQAALANGDQATAKSDLQKAAATHAVWAFNYFEATRQLAAM